MLGLMQETELLISRFIEHAGLNSPNVEVVSNLVEGGIHRSNWGAIRIRSKKVAQGLGRLGVKQGDRVATLAWNGYRHLEAWFGISGMGAVTHTINPRLFPEQIRYIANHAEDQVMFLDLTFVPIMEKLAAECPTIRHYIILTDRAHMPATTLPGALCYEEFVAAEDGDYEWPQFSERSAASLCYTSGTTGNPKGVLSSHRSTTLHTLAANGADTIGMGAADVILPIVPMFHVNAWGIPFSAASVGCKIVFNGPAHDAPTLQKLILDEGVTGTAAVPTIWLAMLGHLEQTGTNLGTLKKVVIGGSAAPRTMIEAFEAKYGVEVRHAWGMTETSPLGTVGSLNAKAAALPHAGQLDYKVKQGRRIFGVELMIADEAGNRLPEDGKTSGHLLVRGPWIVREYFGGDGGQILNKDGWFDTGDVACIDPDGYMQITDRSKDVIKSGGEWISSIDVENAAVGHPDVKEAAVIGVAHPKWTERPILVLVANSDKRLSKDEMNNYLSDKIAKWWLPDDVVYVDELPHTATGKIQKMTLRQQFKDYRLPGS